MPDVCEKPVVMHSASGLVRYEWLKSEGNTQGEKRLKVPHWDTYTLDEEKNGYAAREQLLYAL